MRGVLATLFFLSGMSGLVFEVVWVRQFGNIFGNTITSAALVTGVFMAGLGIGAQLAGRFADRPRADRVRRLVQTYAALELCIGVLGLTLALAFPWLEAASPAISAYVELKPGWMSLSSSSYVLRVVVAVGLLAPITLLMGATLPLLTRVFVAGDVRRAGSAVATLYAVNTAGASLGCFLADAALVPAWGLLTTQAVAASLNLVVCLLALGWLQRTSAPDAESDAHAAPDEVRAGQAGAPSPEVEVDLPKARLRGVGAALALSGLAGMALEIVWFRFLSSVLQTHRATFSHLLTVLLIGLWSGALVGAWLHRRFGRPALAWSATLVLFAWTAVGGFLIYGPEVLEADAVVVWHDVAPAPIAWALEHFQSMRVILLVIGLPTLCLGASFPLANAVAQRSLQQVGRRVGGLYLANTLGGLAGSLLAGFVLLPALGMQGAVWVVLGVVVAAVGVLLPSVRDELGVRASGDPPPPIRVATRFTAPVLAVVALVGWTMVDDDRLINDVFARDDVQRHKILIQEGLTETIAITERPPVGEGGLAERVLYVDGKLMSGTLPGPQRYMRALAHLPLLMQEEPERVMVICFGVGNTLHAASLHPSVRELEVVDLSRQILDHASYFAAWNGDVLKDPRTKVFINDGRQHLRMVEPQRYDLITLEPPPLTGAGVASLYSTEFYALAKSRLRAGGAVSQWLPAYQVSGPVALGAIRSFLEVFPNAVMLSGYKEHFILLGRRDATTTVDPAELGARIAARPAVAVDLARYDLKSMSALVGTFVADAEVLEQVTRRARPVTDDDPTMEYSLISQPFHESELPEELFRVDRIDAWCPTCRIAEEPPVVEGLAAHLQLLDVFYRSERFRIRSRTRKTAPPRWQLSDPDGKLQTAWANSAYLRDVIKR